MSSNPRIPYQLPDELPTLPLINGKRVAINVVVNVEHWPFDRPMPRALMTPPHGKGGDLPDVPNFSWVEYGMRRGMPRLLNFLNEKEIRATATINANVCSVYPALAGRIGEAGWDIVGHGLSQQSLKVVDDETATVGDSLATLESFYGKRVRGWLGPGIAQTAHTPEVLKAAGLDYTQDWMVDDVPLWMQTKQGPLIALPYTLELNDVPIWAIQNHGSDEMFQRIQHTIDILAAEATRSTQIMTIALHPHLIGVPHRFHYFMKTINHLLAHPDVTFTTSDQIADWFLESNPAPSNQMQ